jgi:2-polyprenyl-3-methyl-5-hydroxy-6-metoxy-1,4-benzoquinol methylase
MQEYYTNERKEILPFIPVNIRRTLDVGCASGNFSAQLKARKNIEAWGIEMVEDAANEAKSKLDNVLSGTFDEVYDSLPKDYFDCIFFNDVLEHMAYPEECLIRAKENLTGRGYILASIPNMRHIEVLRELIFKKDWEYKDSGIQDKTHLRFYTEKSMRRMIDLCGYKIERMEGINGVSPYCLTSFINLVLFNRLKDVKYKQYVILASAK